VQRFVSTLQALCALWADRNALETARLIFAALTISIARVIFLVLLIDFMRLLDIFTLGTLVTCGT
jgi:hypothetical protein